MNFPYRKETYVWYLPFQVQYLITKYLLRKDMYWTSDGALCERMPKGHGVEETSWFPGWIFLVYAWYHNNLKWRVIYYSRKLKGEVI